MFNLSPFVSLLVQVYCWKGLRFSARQDLDGFSRVWFVFLTYWTHWTQASIDTKPIKSLILLSCSLLNMVLKGSYPRNFCHLMCDPNTKLNQVGVLSGLKRKKQKQPKINQTKIRCLEKRPASCSLVISLACFWELSYRLTLLLLSLFWQDGNTCKWDWCWSE